MNIAADDSVKISVIIPVYDVDKYLEQCIDSVINQTFGDFEIICINDCSKDNSAKILQSYAQKDSRIIIISNSKNKGLGITRNIAQNQARGKYIFFLDSDDYIALECFEKLYKKITEDESDVVYFNAMQFNDDDNKMIPKIDMGRIFRHKIPDKPFYAMTKYRYFLQKSGEVWYKMYRKDFLLDNSIFCSEHRLCEDRLFRINLLFANPKTSILNEAFYFHRLRHNSLSNKLYSDYSNIFDIHEKCIESIINSNIPYKKKLVFIKYQILWLIIWTNKKTYSEKIRDVNRRKRKKVYIKMLKYFTLDELAQINLSRTFWDDLQGNPNGCFGSYLDYDNGNPKFIAKFFGKQIKYTVIMQKQKRTFKQRLKSYFAVYNDKGYKKMNIMGFVFEIKKKKTF